MQGIIKSLPMLWIATGFHSSQPFVICKLNHYLELPIKCQYFSHFWRKAHRSFWQSILVPQTHPHTEDPGNNTQRPLTASPRLKQGRRSSKQPRHGPGSGGRKALLRLPRISATASSELNFALHRGWQAQRSVRLSYLPWALLAHNNVNSVGIQWKASFHSE